MKTDNNILIAFILNLSFSAFELFGGLFTKSVAILSDSLHDFGDAISIGLSYFLEKKSRADADDSHTYGYRRYSVLGGLITTLILMVGSVIMIREAVERIFAPVSVNARGMILFAVIGAALNLIAAFVTREGDSINQKAVNLHMLEDVLGWIVVLVGAVLMRFTDFSILDPLMSIGVAAFIFCGALKNLKQIIEIFLENTPTDVDISRLKAQLSGIAGVEDVHHLHIRSMDGYHHYATLHVVTKAENQPKLKAALREALAEHHIIHAVIETEAEACGDVECRPSFAAGSSAAHHHGHHG